MIGKDKALRRVCTNYEQVENYYEAVTDEELWDLHHRREIDENKSRQQLKDEGKYYDVKPEELIFLTHSEHAALHCRHREVTEEMKEKISSTLILRYSKEPFHMTGKQHSAETKKKISECMSGEKNPMFGKKCWNNGIVQVFSKEQPGPDFVRGRLKSNK